MLQTCLYAVLSGLKIHPNKDFIMKIVIKDTFSKPLFNIQKNCMNLMIYSFSLKKIKIGKVEKLIANLHDQKRICYTFKTRNFKQALNHGSVLQKLHRVIRFNQKS